MQVIANVEILTNFEIALFCISGSISTLLVAYILILLIKKIILNKNKIFKAICYYTTITFLILDPLYLTIIYKFVGGVDMNGILLFGIEEIEIQVIFLIVLIINIILIIMKVYPLYKKSFNQV